MREIPEQLSRPVAMTRHYRMCGLILASAYELPGAIRVEPGSEVADVQLRRCASLPTVLEHATAHGPNWSAAGEQVLLSIPGVARCLLTAGRDVAVEAEAGAHERDIAPFLEVSVLAILLHQRRRLTLRASAVSLAGKAVVFCGGPGTGKSTLAAFLNARGYPFFADDLCCVGGGEPVITPDGGTLKLWGDAVDRLAMHGRRGPALRRGVQKFHVEPMCVASPPSLPIAAIYMMRDDHPTLASGISPLPVGEAAMLLRRNAYNSHLAALTGSDEPLFDQAAALQRRVKLFSLTRPMDFDATPQMIDWLEAHWRSPGFIGAAT